MLSFNGIFDQGLVCVSGALDQIRSNHDGWFANSRKTLFHARRDAGIAQTVVRAPVGQPVTQLVYQGGSLLVEGLFQAILGRLALLAEPSRGFLNCKLGDCLLTD